MQRLTPLMICLLVAMAAVSSIGKSARWKKVVALHSGVAGKRDIAFAERKIIGFANLVCVYLAHNSFCCALVLRAADCP